jgi:suppressor of ftsI
VSLLKGKIENRRFTRREFLRLGLATGAAAYGGGLLGLPGCGGSGAAEGAPTDYYQLNVGYSERVLGGYRVRTRTYNGSLPGPVMTTRPGNHLWVEVVNQLPPNPPVTPPPGIDPTNNPHGFNTTNLHVHGLQVVPHIYDPIGTSDPEAPMIMIEPGQSFLYPFTLPANHPSGLYWYHPHNHGATDLQVCGGMAGGILVRGPIDQVPEIAAARDELMVVQIIKVNPDLVTPGLWTWEPIAYAPPTMPTSNAGGFDTKTQIQFITVNGQAVQKLDYTTTPAPTWTELDLPTYTLQPGEVIRLRILSGLDVFLMPLVLEGFEIYLIGIDGINLLTPQLLTGNTVQTALRVGPANRAELLIRAPMKSISSTLVSLAQSENPAPNPQFALANFVISGSPKPMAIPTSLPVPTREYPFISTDEIVAERTFAFGTARSSSIILGTAFLINGLVFEENRIDAGPAVDTAEQWTLLNANGVGHPFHLHTHSFEVLGLPFDESYHEIQDTIWLPPAIGGVPSSVTIRMRIKQFLGKDVFHCHILPHEDQGMMTNFLVSPTGDPSANAGAIDPAKVKVSRAYCEGGRLVKD